MKRILLLILTLTISIFALASCADGSDNLNSSGGSMLDKGEGESSANPDYTGSENGTVKPPESNRKIIKTVNQSVQTEACDEFLASLNEAIAAVDGYISSSNYRGNNYYNDSSLRYASITVRVPAERLDDFTKSVNSLAVVTYFSENVSDVTLSYIDIESRISVLEAEETALKAMLGKAENVTQMLSIRQSLLDVQSDLASLRAQKNSYDDKIAYSTVNLTVNEVKRAVAQSKNPGFFEEVAINFSDNLYDIGQFFRGLAVWLLGDSLVIIIWAAVITGIVLLYRLWKKRNPDKKGISSLFGRKSCQKNSNEKDNEQ